MRAPLRGLIEKQFLDRREAIDESHVASHIPDNYNRTVI